MNEETRNEFSVYSWDKDGNQHEECRFVSMDHAIERFALLTGNVAAKTGITRRVIVTDGEDFTNMEWVFNEGITYPLELKGRILLQRRPVQ